MGSFTVFYTIIMPFGLQGITRLQVQIYLDYFIGQVAMSLRAKSLYSPIGPLIVVKKSHVCDKPVAFRPQMF